MTILHVAMEHHRDLIRGGKGFIKIIYVTKEQILSSKFPADDCDNFGCMCRAEQLVASLTCQVDD